jgi:hypothetical protein
MNRYFLLLFTKSMNQASKQATNVVKRGLHRAVVVRCRPTTREMAVPFSWSVYDCSFWYRSFWYREIQQHGETTVLWFGSLYYSMDYHDVVVLR